MNCGFDSRLRSLAALCLAVGVHVACGSSNDSRSESDPLTDGSVAGTSGTPGSGGTASGGTSGRGGATSGGTSGRSNWDGGGGGMPSTGGDGGGTLSDAGPTNDATTDASNPAQDAGGGDGSIDCSAVGCSMPPLCSTGCEAPCGCCACGEGEEQGEYVCSGGCWAPRDDSGAASCQTDPDCPTGYWCRETQTGGRECVPFAAEGDFCGGFTPIWGVSRCAPGLECTDTPPFIADAPGRCREPCTGNGDCAGSSYCAPNNDVCRDDGACFGDSDCNAAGNDYPHMACPGYGTCASGSCSWTCGDPACRDLTGVNFGVCTQFLGWAVQGSECVGISGCSNPAYTFFSSENECRTACGL